MAAFKRVLSVLGSVILMSMGAGAAHAQDDAEAEKSPKVFSLSSTETEAENTLLLDLSTGGRVTIRLFPRFAPNHVERIKTLARQGFYDGLKFHRVIDGFMAQTGDPLGTGLGGSSLPDLKAEFSGLPHVRGVVAMARSESDDSANSQFYIVLMPSFGLDRKYTVFGRVIDGMEYVDAIHKGEPPVDPSTIVQASIAADGKPPRFTPPVVADPVAANDNETVVDMQTRASE